MISSDGFFAIIYTVFIRHTNHHRSQIGTQYHLSLIIRHKRIFKIDIEKYFISFGDIILHIQLNSSGSRKRKGIRCFFVSITIRIIYITGTTQHYKNDQYVA